MLAGQWAGATVCVIAGGPSLTAADVELVRGQGWRALAINDAYRLAPWCDILYACDGRWWNAHQARARQAAEGARLVTRDTKAAADYELEWIESANEPGLSRDPALIHEGGNSGYQAINLAYHLGVQRIVLLGFDMQKTGGKSHWFGDHPAGMNVPSPYDAWRGKFTALAADLAAEGVEVINCSRATALEAFRRAELENII